MQPFPFSSARGSVLFIVLLGCALFAAVSYAVVSGFRLNAASVTTAQEDASLAANRISEFALNVDTGVKQMMVKNRIKDYQINYANDLAKKNNNTAINGALGSPSDPTYYLFHPQGGGIAPQLFTDLSVTCASCNTAGWVPGHFGLRWAAMSPSNVDPGKLTLMIYGLKDAVCTELNKRQGITGIPAGTVAIQTPAIDTPPTAISAGTGADAASLANRRDYCASSPTVDGVSNPGNYYHHVIN